MSLRRHKSSVGRRRGALWSFRGRGAICYWRGQDETRASEKGIWQSAATIDGTWGVIDGGDQAYSSSWGEPVLPRWVKPCEWDLAERGRWYNQAASRGCPPLGRQPSDPDERAGLTVPTERRLWRRWRLDRRIGSRWLLFIGRWLGESILPGVQTGPVGRTPAGRSNAPCGPGSVKRAGGNAE